MNIEDVIQQYFPDELKEPEAFEDWLSPLRGDAIPGSADLFKELDKKLSLEKGRQTSETSIHRDYWELFGGEDKLIKSIPSIRSKLARDLLDEFQKDSRALSRQTKEQLVKRVYGFGDLGRIRIVADFPSDIDHLQKILFDSKRFLGSYSCPKGIKDFVFDPRLRDGLKGHRARQFSVRVKIDDRSDFGFEIQLMTRLQHAWDRRNHPLYEWQRENPDWLKDQEAVELAVDDFACSEALHLVDRQADINWIRLQDKLKNSKEVIS
jgi:ppGpp synthetase/RelA/SpoT-type nucleotidyltranferase